MSRHNGDHGTIDVVNPWLCPVVWVVVGVQECTQIDEDGLSVPFCCIRVRCYNESYNVNSDAGCDASYSVNCDASCDVNCV